MGESLTTSNYTMKEDDGRIGDIVLTNGDTIRISPMYDFFINYMFEDSGYWEVLKILVNIFLEWYKDEMCRCTQIDVIEDEIKVETQYAYFTGVSKQKSQDLKISGVNTGTSTKFVEFQIKARPELPIKTRAQHYLGFSLAAGKGGSVNQIWLLAENVPELVSDVGVSNYVLIDEVKHGGYPDTSSIMFLSLQTLSKLTNVVGELASFLLDWDFVPTDSTVSWIKCKFNDKFKILKKDREATKMLITRESELSEAEARGKVKVVRNMAKKGFTLEQISEAVEMTIEEIKRILAS